MKTVWGLLAVINVLGMLFATVLLVVACVTVVMEGNYSAILVFSTMYIVYLVVTIPIGVVLKAGSDGV